MRHFFFKFVVFLWLTAHFYIVFELVLDFDTLTNITMTPSKFCSPKTMLPGVIEMCGSFYMEMCKYCG